VGECSQQLKGTNVIRLRLSEIWENIWIVITVI
jgi:hypothetical protein